MPLEPIDDDKIVRSIDLLINRGLAERFVNEDGEPSLRLLKPAVRITYDNGTLRKFEDIERDIIERAVQICDGNRAETCRYLGIGRSTIYRKILGGQRP